MTFTVADLRKLPLTTVTVTLRTDQGSQGIASYTGPLLYTVIQQTVPISNTSFKNDFLRQFVTVGATDGYQVSVSMAEITPQFGNEKVILAYEKDGKPLSQAEGAVRLIVPGDYLAGRWVSNVNSVIVGTPVGTP
jgi:DMSO/TMAO reductase YedYZ molybdopterin-dependent catalytic subunit